MVAASCGDLTMEPTSIGEGVRDWLSSLAGMSRQVAAVATSLPASRLRGKRETTREVTHFGFCGRLSRCVMSIGWVGGISMSEGSMFDSSAFGDSRGFMACSFLVEAHRLPLMPQPLGSKGLWSIETT